MSRTAAAAAGPSPALKRAATWSTERSGLDEDEADYLTVNSPFTLAEIRSLWRLFQQVDIDGSGRISQSELCKMPHLAFNPLSQRVVDFAFRRRMQRQLEMQKQKAALGSMANGLTIGIADGGEAAGDGEAADGGAMSSELSFSDFVHVLSPFAAGASADDKIRLAFAVFDFDGDGKLGEADLQHMLRVLLPEGTEDGLINQVVEMTLQEADKDNDGALDMREFKQAIDKDDFKAKLTMTI